MSNFSISRLITGLVLEYIKVFAPQRTGEESGAVNNVENCLLKKPLLYYTFGSI
jgi:hypothetical protein